MLQRWLESAKPPKWLWRSIAAIVLGGQVATRILKGECSASLLRLSLGPARSSLTTLRLLIVARWQLQALSTKSWHCALLCSEGVL